MMNDREVLTHIEELIAEEQRLYGSAPLGESDRERLDQIQVKLDQFWDLLRQRRALRNAGADPDSATLRGPEIVENYEQ
jgi:hypothetical protein